MGIEVTASNTQPKCLPVLCCFGNPRARLWCQQDDQCWNPTGLSLRIENAEVKA